MKVFLFLFLLAPQIVQAKLLVAPATTGASAISFDNKGNATIFGGTAFPSDDTTSECATQTVSEFGLTTTCNGCTTALQSCNSKRISDLLVLKIVFSVDTAPSEGPVLVTTENNIEIEQSLHQDEQSAGPNQVTTAHIEWAEFCSLTGDGYCNNSPGNITIKVGIDSDEDGKISTEEGGFITIKVQNPNHTTEANLSSTDCTKAGVCDFEIFSGNEKAFIGKIKKSSRFPDWGGSTFNKLKIFYSIEGFQEVTPLSDSLEVSINSSTSLEEEFVIAPLNNNSQYYFRVAVVDQAKNIAFITSNEKIQSVCGGNQTLTVSQCNSCPYCIRPANVVGILKKDLNCFITTATYGSNQAPLVKLFREFRNKILLKFKFGVWLTKKYYRWGSQASLILEKYPVLKIFSRLALTPLAVFVWISLHLHYLFLLVSIFLLLLIRRKLKMTHALSVLIFFLVFQTPVQNIKAKTFSYKKNKFSRSSPTYNFYSFQVGPYTPLNLRGEEASFAEIYGTSKNFMLLLSYEKNLFSNFGLLSLEFGTGLMVTTAYGLKEGTVSEKSHEKLLFLLVPNHSSLVYRFQYSPNPFISPYIKAGVTAFGILESPLSSGTQAKLALAPAGHIAAGLGINIINWSSSKKELHNDYAMHSFLIFAEYKVYKNLSKKFNLSNNMISAGLSLGF